MQQFTELKGKVEDIFETHQESHYERIVWWEGIFSSDVSLKSKCYFWVRVWWMAKEWQAFLIGCKQNKTLNKGTVVMMDIYRMERIIARCELQEGTVWLTSEKMDKLYRSRPDFTAFNSRDVFFFLCCKSFVSSCFVCECFYSQKKKAQSDV